MPPQTPLRSRRLHLRTLRGRGLHPRTPTMPGAAPLDPMRSRGLRPKTLAISKESGGRSPRHRRGPGVQPPASQGSGGKAPGFAGVQGRSPRLRREVWGGAAPQQNKKN